jgi:hypothetical protein
MTGKQLSLLGGPFGAGAAGDPNWQNVTLLSGTTTTNAGQNNTFIDSSSNAFTITRNGNTTQGTFSPFSQTDGYWSNYFDGSGDYISLPNSSISLGSGNCAVEFWCYITGEPSANPFLFDNYGNGSARLFAYYDGTTMYLNADSVTKTTSFAYNTWNFFQFTRSSGTGGWYLNGNLIDTTFSTSGTINLQRMTIGAAEESGTANPNQWYQGYISNFRASNTNRSTSVPTTPFSSDANAVVLTCQSNRFVDNSASPLTLTITGNAAVIPFQRFDAPIVPYSASTIGGSGYFDQNGDYLDCGNGGTDYEFGSGDFTIEGWFYCLGKSERHQMIMAKGSPTTNNAYDWRLYWGDTANNRIWFDSNVFSVSSDTTTTEDLVLNAWNHIAVVRSGANGYLYLNGTRIDSVAASGTMNNSYTNVYVGAGNVGSAGQTYYNGYASSIRLLKGTAQYTGSTYTVPTSPFTAITNTELLLNFTNANIYDQAADNNFETAGNAQVSTSVFKYGTSSMAFDGNGDYLARPNSPLYDMRASEFTIEGWMYQTNSSVDQTICAKYEPSYQASWYIGTTSTANWGVYFYYGASSNLVVYTGAAPSLNTWHHFALVRCSDRVLFYVDGNQLANVAAQTMRTTTSGLSIGRTGEGYTEYFYGYLSDIRITKGVGRYPYNFTPPTTSLPNFYQAQTLTADPYFDYTTLLLPGSGTNGAQNNTFLDSSSNTFSITRNGNTTQGTFSPFSQTGWSNYFDGTGDYLSTADSISLGSGDFTVGCWVYLNATGAEMPVVCSPNYYRSGYNGNFVMRVGTSNLYNSFDGQSSGAGISGTYSWQTNTWFYVAWVRSGSTITVYRNGMSLGTVSSSRDLSDSANGLYIAVNRINNAIQSDNLNGYISNLRILVGTADTAVPTAPFTAITNTKLLTCQSNRFVDENTQVAAKTITVNGDTSVQAFSPFNPTAAYSAATNGGSGYFDGTGDYLSTSTSQIIPTGSFTIEAWVYTTQAISTAKNIVSQGTSGDSGRVAMSIEGSLWWFQIGSNVVNAGTPILGQWNYVAMTYNGSTIQGYVNGVSQGTVSNTNNPQNTTLSIGKEWLNQHWNGYIASVRISNTVRTVTTVPTTPFTTDANTRFLCNFTNAGITDATAKNDFETVGNAQISNGQAKWGGTSIYFDGSGGDAILTPMSPNLQLLGSDWTIEYWLYANSWVTGDIMGSFKSGAYCWIIQMNGSGVTMYNTLSTTYSFSATLSTGQWYHVALSNYGLRLRCFINGTQIGSTQTITAFPTATRPLYIGYNEDNGGGAAGYNGYLQDVRITTGIARYTQNFTPPTAAFQLL